MAEGPSAENLIEFIAHAIVTEPDEVKVRSVDGGRLIELETAPQDRGRVIGRQGRVAKAMRAVLTASRGRAPARRDLGD